MKKSHGPAFRKTLKPLRECLDCRGVGVVRGVFHEMECATCNASGWICAETGAALPLTDLVLQLNMKLQVAEQIIRSLQRPASGPGQQYEQNNRRGAGGTNYTGD